VRALEAAQEDLFELGTFAIENDDPVSEEIIDCLADDLNTWTTFAQLVKFNKAKEYRKLGAAMNFLNLPIWPFKNPNYMTKNVSPVSETLVNEMLDNRNSARAAKYWKESDRIRDELDAMGVAIKDNKDGTTSWEIKR
jgi:cysteinyl-tRNA synthetase